MYYSYHSFYKSFAILCTAIFFLYFLYLLQAPPPCPSPWAALTINFWESGDQRNGLFHLGPWQTVQMEFLFKTYKYRAVLLRIPYSLIISIHSTQKLVVVIYHLPGLMVLTLWIVDRSSAPSCAIITSSKILNAHSSQNVRIFGLSITLGTGN